MKTKPHYSGKKVIDYFGGVSECAAKIETVGTKILVRTIEQQRYRDRASAELVAALQLYAANNRIAFDPRDFITQHAEQ